MNDVKDFFDGEGRENYEEMFRRMSEINRTSSATIQKMASGHVISVGGLWPGATPDTVPENTTVIDIASNMLELWSDFPVETKVADALDLPFESNSVGALVYPMVLHHLCEGTARDAREKVRQAFKEAERVLTPDGKLFIVDYEIWPPVYAVEIAMAPLTRRLLATKDIPLVVMHSQRFYRRALQEAGFSKTERIETGENEHPFAMIQPVIGLPWLVVPRFVYPVNPLFMISSFQA